MTIDMMLSSKLFVASFKDKESRKSVENLLDVLDINYMEFEIENSDYKYRIDIYID